VEGETVAVCVTDWPTLEGLGALLKEMEAEVFTVCVNTPEVAAVSVASPL
jgi:hypothetical protein